MKFIIVILLAVSTAVLAQPYTKVWPERMLSAIKTNQPEVVGTIYGDTLFHYLHKDGIEYLRGPIFYFEVISFSNGEYRVDTYNRSEVENGGKINYSSFFNADSIKYKQINSPANPTGIIHFYSNGSVRLNHQIFDSIETIYSQDAQETFYDSKTYVNGVLSEFSFYKDTIINGISMTCDLSVRLPNDTMYFHLQDTLKRTWYRKNESEIVKRSIVGSDTVLTKQRRGDLIFRTTYGTNTINHFSQNSQNTYSESVENRIDQTGYSKYYSNNKLMSGTETLKSKNGVNSTSYNVVNGEKVVTNTTSDLANNRKLYKNYKDGKMVSKAIAEFTEDGQLIKTTRWIGGEKSIILAKDFSMGNTGRCGMKHIARPEQLRPIIDSLFLEVDGEVVESIDRRKIYLKVGESWFNYKQFESYLRTHYKHSISNPKPNIKLELIQQNRNSRSKLHGAYQWSELFTDPFKLNEVSYDALLINRVDKNRDRIKLTLYISLSDRLILLK